MKKLYRLSLLGGLAMIAGCSTLQVKSKVEAGRRDLLIGKNDSAGQFWDPARTIRTEIGVDLAMLSGSELDWPKLLAGGEWVGKQTEQEIDPARRDEPRLYESDGATKIQRR